MASIEAFFKMFISLRIRKENNVANYDDVIAPWYHIAPLWNFRKYMAIFHLKFGETVKNGWKMSKFGENCQSFRYFQQSMKMNIIPLRNSSRYMASFHLKFVEKVKILWKTSKFDEKCQFPLFSIQYKSLRHFSK